MLEDVARPLRDGLNFTRDGTKWPRYDRKRANVKRTRRLVEALPVPEVGQRQSELKVNSQRQRQFAGGSFR